MSMRIVVLTSVACAGLAMGGCAGGIAMFEGEGSFLGSVVADSAPQRVPMAEPAKVLMQPGDAAATLNPEKQIGYVIEDRSPSPRAYRLDTGDKLRVFVYGQPNLSRIYGVDQSGNISVPLIGNVKARGLTTVGLEGAIRGRLAQGLVRDPQVTVDVQQNRPFFILGEVRTPGQFPYVTGMTAEMAVAIAGGFSERANERKVRLSRRVNGYNEVIDVPTDAELEPGDTVYVYERFF